MIISVYFKLSIGHIITILCAIAGLYRVIYTYNSYRNEEFMDFNSILLTVFMVILIVSAIQLIIYLEIDILSDLMTKSVDEVYKTGLSG